MKTYISREEFRLSAITRVCLPLDPGQVETLTIGTPVRLFGSLYTARDAAHKRLIQALRNGEDLPLSLKSELLYYVGPCPARPGRVIGSAGPTTSGRVDSYTPQLLAEGLKGMMGKGDRAPEVVESIKKHKAVYFAALGGAGATLAAKIKKAEVIAYPDLGPEAIYRLEVEDFPAVVAIDAFGNNLYQEGRRKYTKG